LAFIADAAVGGMANAGKGIKISIIDSGVEATNPAFQDPSLPTPPGYPLQSGRLPVHE